MFRPRVEFTVPDPGWTVAAESTDVFELALFDPRGETDQEPDVYVDGAQVQVVFERPCASSPTRTIAERPRALIDWLVGHEHLQTSDPRPVSFGGFTGRQVDVAYARAPGEDCAPFASDTERRRLHLFPVGSVTFMLDPGERARVITVDAEGRPLTLLVGTYDPNHRNDFQAIAEPVVESFAIVP